MRHVYRHLILICVIVVAIGLAIIPPIVMFLIFQRRFVASIAQTGLKG